jgi:hypothetical protein
MTTRIAAVQPLNNDVVGASSTSLLPSLNFIELTRSSGVAWQTAVLEGTSASLESTTAPWEG